MANGSLTFEGYIMRDGIVILFDDGKHMQIHIGELVNRDDLIARLSPEDALRIGSWHGAYHSRKSRFMEQEVRHDG